MGDHWMIFTSPKQISAASWPRNLPHLRVTGVMSRLWEVEMGRMWFELTKTGANHSTLGLAGIPRVGGLYRYPER